MMPSSLSLSSSLSSISTTIRVDKATSELLAGPDWTMNMEICDLCNSNHWMAKDVVKGVKRRLKHKNPRVQLLTLTLLETMVKNCGEYIHYQIAERKILDELVKIVKKKGDMHVREKILSLLDSWQEAFGGPGGKYSQYYWACDELRRSGAQFPQRPQSSAPVVTPPVTHQPRVPQIGYGMPSDSSRRLDDAMTSEVDTLSFSTLESMQNALELLTDMLQAVNYGDRMALKDEVIIDLVDRCRGNQKKLMQMISTTTDEGLLAQGLEMNDSLQTLLKKHDELASGVPPPDHGKHISTQESESIELNAKQSEVGNEHPTSNGKSPAIPASVAKDKVEEEEEEEDEFALLSRRHLKTQSGPSQQSGTSCVTEEEPSSSGSTNALALIDTPGPPAPTTNNPKEQDLIDLLSLVLTTPSETPEETPISAPAQNTFETSFNNYVVPWAQTQPQTQPQPQPQPMLPQLQNQYQPMQPQMQQHTQYGYSQYGPAYPPPPWEATSAYNNHQNFASNPYMYPNYQGNMNNGSVPMQGQFSSQNVNEFQYPQYGNQRMPMYSTTANSATFSPTETNRSLQSNSLQNPSSPMMNSSNNGPSVQTQGIRSLQHTNSFPARAGNPSALNGSTLVTNGSTPVTNGNPSALNGSTLVTNGSTPVTNGIASTPGQKPFVPSYRLFEDLNVLNGSEGKLKSGPYPSASGNTYENMVTGRR